MAAWSTMFKWQYDYARGVLKQVGGFAPEWADTIRKLEKLLGPTGFDAGSAEALDDLRRRSRIADGKPVSADKGFLAAAKAGGNAGPTIGVDAKRRASVLKFISHVYLKYTAGNRKVWIHSAPKVFKHWPTMHFEDHGSSAEAVRGLLNSANEQFTERQKSLMAYAVHHALAWSQKANMLLANAGSRDQGKRAAARAIVRRWFALPGAPESEIDGYVSTLAKGFKDITAMLNKGSLILTDHLPVRGSNAQEDIDLLGAYAFTFAGRHEGLDVVYIESFFFKDVGAATVKGPRNWILTIVHELSHLVCGTDDVKKGWDRYADNGILPKAPFLGSDAINNADSWAFFCGEAAASLTTAEINHALRK